MWSGEDKTGKKFTKFPLLFILISLKCYPTTTTILTTITTTYKKINLMFSIFIFRYDTTMMQMYKTHTLYLFTFISLELVFSSLYSK